MVTTVIQHVLNRLRDLGIRHVFGVPGDYAFPVDDAVIAHPDIQWMGNCNELNAAYCADGYARVHGMGAVSTTYGVGELSAINGIAGAYTEHLPVFHLVGMPKMPVQARHALVHHTLGNGEFDLFQRMSDPVVCASAIMTPQNVAAETERLIAAAIYHRRPVYLAFPADLAELPVASEAPELPAPASDPAQLDAAVAAVSELLRHASSACLLPGALAVRAGLGRHLQRLVDASGLPFATMVADKGVLDEDQPGFVGMYDGKLMNGDVRRLVEDGDVVILVGALMHDFNSGAFTANLDPAKTVDIRHHHVQVGAMTYPSVEMRDLLTALAARLPTRTWPQPAADVVRMRSEPGSGDDPITAGNLYPRWEQFLRPRDIVVAETGTCSMGMAFARLPYGATFENQTLWGSIGWATPAAVGAAVAAGADRRVVLITGEGSHQLTAQEISQFGRYRLKPVVFVLNNSGYLIERLLCKHPDLAYNDLARWNYAELPRVLGCEDWFTARVSTCAELDRALDTARHASAGCYIEVLTDSHAAPPLATRMHENVGSLYAGG
ncbi:alpha-keto acid decarboxylase family protein [Frankia sp. AgB1.9]|uniref:alpha-keto acid decarboxylase family protein n=1 Tax=unclassified Frankia TaxID=2632575 RepID=UPI0019333331|nr:MULTISPECIES: thiamine pyrophosphate-binding protein [unclassified Frankia]MBL7489651.1 alpha-keto acid decarboxylase family protein [Frankia sp. AgW1.1]MBL7548617.1 alpha-keto acid decarboxylase family protein [Frankia sp. AgB1.9]MBL7621569.1 alpha-keto acid decarboxylase family protein [Frankia sp. AgB1.8]